MADVIQFPVKDPRDDMSFEELCALAIKQCEEIQDVCKAQLEAEGKLIEELDNVADGFQNVSDIIGKWKV